MDQGQIHFVRLDSGPQPGIVVSSEPYNRGLYVLAVLCTSTRLDERSRLPSCVPFQAGEFGFTKDCVAQCERVTLLRKSDLDSEIVGTLNPLRMREIIRAIGHVLDCDCEPR
jgi:mRNA-degrading endonuclease toxin of MazEF toxin-antitoxin module